MKRNSHDDDLRLVHIDRLRSRIDESLISLDRGEGTEGAKFMEEMLGGLHSRKVKRKVVNRKAG